MPDSIYDQAEQSAEALRALTSIWPRVAIVLGSGLGSFANRLNDSVSVPYEELPHFPRSTVEGHSGRLWLGSLAGVPLALMQGRVHGYEGYSAGEVVFPVRVLCRLGVKTLIVTNAAGAIRTDLYPGQLVLLRDHINFTGTHPLTGPNDSSFGARFFDMTDAYSSRLRQVAQAAAEGEGLTIPEGVYLGLSGPSYETPAEIRAFRMWGADLVGMSTVHEVIAARHLGMEVIGISCVTNMAAGVLAQPIDHAEVMETGARVQEQFTRLLTALIPRLQSP